MSDMTVAELATRLGVSQRRANDLLATSAIDGRQLSNGVRLADADSVTRYELRRKRAGRNLDARTAWAILYELSGRPVNWLPRSTHGRMRMRIREGNVEELASAVATRTRVHRYRSANSERAAVDLIPTGRAAVEIVQTDLITDSRRAQGYVPAGTTVAEYATTHFMLPDDSGTDLLYENTAPEGLGVPLPAVVAADLAMSTDTRERSAGIGALRELREAWLEKHTR